MPEYHKGLTQKINENVQNAYKQLIQLRRNDQTLIYGNFEVINKKKNHFTYKRTLNNEYIIDCNLSNSNQKATLFNGYTCIYPNNIKDLNILSPYEARIYKKEK